MPKPPATGIDEQHRDFIQGGVSVLVASRDEANVPAVTRGCGCTVDGDGRVLVYVPASRSQDVLRAIQASATIAVVFSEPSSHRTIQLKGSDAEIVANLDIDKLPNIAYRDAFGAELVRLGFEASMAMTLVHAEAEDVRAIRFTPAAIFNQTPGPGAGELMRAQS